MEKIITKLRKALRGNFHTIKHLLLNNSKGYCVMYNHVFDQLQDKKDWF